MSAGIDSLLEALRKTEKCIDGMHSAFGASGDYGYETAKGRALFDLYRLQVEISAAVAGQETT